MKNTSAVLILFLLFASLAVQPLLASGLNCIMIDSRLLLMAHPVFNSFDSNINRFRGTSSEPIAGDLPGVEAVIEQTKKLQDELLKSSNALREKLKSVPLTERITAEREFLAQKRDLEAKLEAMKMRVYMARLVPIKIGMTPDSSIYTQINAITDSMRQVIRILKQKYKTNVVVDVTDLLPFAPVKEPSALLTTNKHKQALDKNDTEITPELMEWYLEADEYWAAKLGVDSEVIPFGAIDARLEAVKLMEQESEGYKTWEW